VQLGVAAGPTRADCHPALRRRDGPSSRFFRKNELLEMFLSSDCKHDRACKEFIDFLSSNNDEWQVNYTSLKKLGKER
jgi:hypothetical protein